MLFKKEERRSYAVYIYRRDIDITTCYVIIKDDAADAWSWMYENVVEKQNGNARIVDVKRID